MRAPINLRRLQITVSCVGVFSTSHASGDERRFLWRFYNSVERAQAELSDGSALTARRDSGTSLLGIHPAGRGGSEEKEQKARQKSQFGGEFLDPL